MINVGAHMFYQGGGAPVIPRDWKLLDFRTAPNDVALFTPTDLPVIGDVAESTTMLIDALSQSMTATHKQAAKDRIAESAGLNKRFQAARDQVLAARRDDVQVPG